MKIPHAVSTSDEGESPGAKSTASCQDTGDDNTGASKTSTKTSDARTNWNELVQKLFEKDESGQLLLKRDAATRG